MRVRRRLALAVVSLIAAATLRAFEPSSTTPYTFGGTYYCAGCGIYAHDRVGDGNFHSPGCNQSGSPFYFCSCTIGFQSGEMLQPPVLSVVGNDVVVEYWAKNAYCNPPADGGNIHEPNAIPFHIDIIEIDPNSMGSPQTVRVIPPYWEHGKVTLSGLSPGCKRYRAVYYVAEPPFIVYAVSSDAVGATGESGGLSCLADTGSCPIRPDGAPTDGVSPRVALPINVGSANMYYSEHLFGISEPGGGSFDFSITYNSREAGTGSLGTGFTHPFDQRFEAVSGSSGTRLWRGPDGLRVLWARENHPLTGQIWRPVDPGDATGTLLESGTYQMKDLSGTVTEFSISTGRWSKTTDRWGNAITAGYSGSDLTSIVDPFGRTWALTYTGGKLQTFTDGDGNQWRFAYDGSGLLQKIFDPIHTGLTPWRQYVWVSAGCAPRLAAVLDESGAVLEGHEYDANGRAISSWSGPTVYVPHPTPGTDARDLVQLSYDSPTQTTVTSSVAAGVSSTTVYTLAVGSGRFLATSIVGSCSACGRVEDAVAYTFDAENHPLTRIAGSGGDQVETRYSYDANGRVATRIDAYGTPQQRTTSYLRALASWPDFVTSMTEVSVAKPGQSKVTSRSWNGGETLLTESVTGYLTSGDGSATTLTSSTTFDSRHRLLQRDGPVTSQRTSWSYFADDDTTMNRRGRLSQQLLKTSVSATLTTTFDDYDIYGTARSEIDPNGVESERTLDARGRVTAVRSVQPASDPSEPADYVSSMTFDGRDRMTHATNPLGNKTRFDHEDGTNRPLRTTHLDSSGNELERIVMSRNAMGGVTSESSEECATPAPNCASWIPRRTESRTWNANARLETVTHPDASTIVYDYDTRGNLLSVKDERHTLPNTIYAYDALDRLESVTQKQTIVPGADIVTGYGYDLHGNLTNVTDPNGNVTSYLYDDFGRLQRQTSPVTGVTTYSYDAAGNLLSVTDANAAVTARSYDLANRILSASSTRTGKPAETITWTWDDATAGSYGLGRMAAMSDPSGSATFRYERRGLLRREEKSIGDAPYTTTYGYDANGNRTSIVYPSLRAITYGFDGAGRPASVSWGATPLVASASYLPFGPLREIVFGNGTTQTITRDARYLPLTNQVIAAGPVTLASYTYGTDAGGNITAIHDATSVAWNRDFGYDDLNRLTNANAGASLWGAGTYSYDAMGNVLSTTLGSQTTQFTYSGTTPKLASVSAPGGSVTVTYDAGGNETHDQEISARNLVVSVGNALVRTINAFDGHGVRVRSETLPLLVADYSMYHAHIYSPELQPLARHDAHAIRMWGIDFPFHTTEYVWFGDRPVAQLDSTATTTVRYTAADHLGTPFMQTDATASVVWRAEYAPYGAIFAMRNGKALDQPLRFPGQEASDGSGEVYNIFRWYRSGWGKYTQPDPFGVLTDRNLYRYVYGNPVRKIDPLGLDTVGCDGIPDSWETPCRLECCATHDECFRKNSCSEGSWGFNKPKTRCDLSEACQGCNDGIKRCWAKCGPTRGDDPKKPNYYCGKLGRYVTIPGDYPDIATAKKACECDYSTTCTLPPLPPQPPPPPAIPGRTPWRTSPL